MIQLYPHQQEAVEWMRRSENRSRLVADQPHGGILAHAMGLGKTISMLSLIRSQPVGRTLVVCPKSLLMQWTREARVVGFPDDSVMVYHGAGRSPPTHHQLVLTTFEIVRIEFAHGVLHDTVWDRVVLDEAHRICEQSSKTSRAIRSIRACNRWCITGTPFKNGISDLMALSRFLMVGPYANANWWRMFGQSSAKLGEWRRRFLHMRDKSELKDLPPVQQHHIRVRLSPKEREVYDSLGDITWKPKHHARDEQHELLKILRQRQATNHPLLVSACHDTAHVMRGGDGCVGCGATPSATCGEHALCADCDNEPLCVGCIMHGMRSGDAWAHSAKTRALWTYLETQVGLHTPTKLVLFSQWTSCLDLLGCMLRQQGVAFECYDGRVNSTDEREDVIARFRDSDCKVLLTSLGAGGEGVNLTFASHVVLMEPYWNLAVEQQAVDRLHRIGQKHTTHVVRFIAEDTIEEWVQSIQTKKSSELQRVLFGKTELPAVKRAASCIRPQFEDVDEGKRSMGLGAFLRAPKKIKI